MIKTELRPFEIVAPKEYYKDEVCNIYIDEKNIVATDTQVMLIKAHSYNIDEPFMIMNKKVKNTVLKQTDVWNGLPITTDGRYPNYVRVIPSKASIVVTDNKSVLDTLIEIAKFNNITINYELNGKVLTKLSKLIGKVHTVAWNFGAILLETDEYKLIVMRGDVK